MRGTRSFVVVLSTMTFLVSACGSPIVGVLRTATPDTPAKVAQGGHCSQPVSDSDFDRVDPTAVDLNAEAVTEAISYASARGAQSVRVYRHDCLVGTSGLDPSTENTPLPAWSMTKGVVSVVAGRAVTEGHLNVDAPIGDYLSGLDAAHAAITVRQLLTQTSGLRFAWVNDLNAAATLDSAARVLTRPFEAEPGTTFIYAQTTITALVAVVEAAVGEDFQSYATREVFEPIGINSNEWTWGRDAAGRTQGFAFLEMTPKAFARLGSLLANNGKWRDRQIISADYVAQASLGSTVNTGYGFLWRTNRGPAGVEPSEDALRERMTAATPDTYWMSGMFNQNVIMVPELDIVVVRMGLPADAFGDPYGESAGMRAEWEHRFFRTLLAGVTDASVPDPGDWVPDPPGLPNGIDADHFIGIGF